MTDPVTMSFSLNEKAINAAIQAELPRLLKDLTFNYTSGRAPKGLTADVTLTEAQIRQAVTSYARRTVNASFTHLSIQFQATRGEEGQMAHVTCSTAPIQPEEATTRGPIDTAASSVTHEDVGVNADRPDVMTRSTVAAETAEVAEVETAKAVEAEAASEGVADVAQDTGAAAPFETDQAADAPVTAPADAPAEAAAVAKAAPVRSKLFADLKRPDNSTAAE